MAGNSNEAPVFKRWVESRNNPLSGASDAVRFFSADALRAAFIAGYNRRKWETRKVVNELSPDIEPNDNPFA